MKYYFSNIEKRNIDWLLSGDMAIVYQTKRDLLGADDKELKKIQERIASQGWGKRFIKARHSDGHWGRGFYQPKWTSTHYTLLDLKNICFPKGHKEINETLLLILNTERGDNGGINYSSGKFSDVCVNAMILNFGSYFIGKHPDFSGLNEITDFILHTQMNDGGWNCAYLRGAHHSSMNTTISVLEGLLEFRKAGNNYRLSQIKESEKKGVEFLLQHHLFKSHRTGKTINPIMLRFSNPPRWRYDILRALDYLQSSNCAYDERMDDALLILLQKQRADGRWNLQSKHEGHVHFDMEKVGSPSRWNTLRALRVIKYFGNRKELKKN